MPDAETPPAREPLNRDRVLRAGVELADEFGLAGFSMRRLAAHLGFEVMSLYNHVDNKADLLEGMLDLVAGEVDLPDPARVEWTDGLRELAIAQHEMLLRHRWAGSTSVEQFPGPNRWRISEVTLELLAAGGLTGHLRDVGYHAITLHIAGFTAQQLAHDFDDDTSLALFDRVDREMKRDEFPMMADHIDYHRAGDRVPGDRPDEFRFVLDLIIEGLQRRS